VKTNLRRSERDLLNAFAVQRPDHSWSLLMINKDPIRPVRISVHGVNGTKSSPLVHQPATLVTYSANEYRWHADGPNGHPARNAPPTKRTIGNDQPLELPSWSISVLRFR
jgi:hypothetical protein